MAAPGVDQQLLERLADLLDQPERRCRSGCRWPPRRDSSCSTRSTSVADLPVGEPGHRLADRAGQPDGRVEVDGAGVDRCRHQRRSAVGVGVGEGARRSPALGEAERPPQPAAPRSERDAGRAGDLLAGQVGLVAPRMRALEPLAGRAGSSGSVIGPRLVPRARRGRCSSSDTCSCTLLDVRDVVQQRRWPCSLASVTTSVPQPKIRSITPISKSTSLIRLSGMSWPAPGDHARALDQAAVGEGVRRGQPAQERRTTQTSATHARRGPRRRPARAAGVVGRSAAPRTEPATAASSDQRAAQGRSSALTWVRVLTTTCSPSLSSLRGR